MKGTKIKDCILAIVDMLATLGIIVVVALSLFLVTAMVSCSSTSKVTTENDSHFRRELITQMDSIISSRMVIHHDSSFRESILRQMQRIVEKSDTSRYIVTDTAGNVIRERIIINNISEVTSETERLEREFIMHKLETIDSTLTVMQRQMEMSDSLQQVINEKETIIKEQGFLEKVQQWATSVVLAVLFVATIWVCRKPKLG